jgi:hypothetical protein
MILLNTRVDIRPGNDRKLISLYKKISQEIIRQCLENNSAEGDAYYIEKKLSEYVAKNSNIESATDLIKNNRDTISDLDCPTQYQELDQINTNKMLKQSSEFKHLTYQFTEEVINIYNNIHTQMDITTKPITEAEFNYLFPHLYFHNTIHA